MNRLERKIWNALKIIVPQFEKELYFLRDRQNFVTIGDSEPLEVTIEINIRQMERFVLAFKEFEFAQWKQSK